KASQYQILFIGHSVAGLRWHGTGCNTKHTVALGAEFLVDCLAARPCRRVKRGTGLLDFVGCAALEDALRRSLGNQQPPMRAVDDYGQASAFKVKRNLIDLRIVLGLRVAGRENGGVERAADACLIQAVEIGEQKGMRRLLPRWTETAVEHHCTCRERSRLVTA